MTRFFKNQVLPVLAPVLLAAALLFVAQNHYADKTERRVKEAAALEVQERTQAAVAAVQAFLQGELLRNTEAHDRELDAAMKKLLADIQTLLDRPIIVRTSTRTIVIRPSPARCKGKC